MDGSILEFFTGFCSYLQDHSFPVSESELARLVRSIGEAGIDITKEEEVVTASTVCLAKTGEQAGMIRLLFREYVMQKILPVTEQEQEAQKKERKEALDALTQDRLKKDQRPGKGKRADPGRCPREGTAGEEVSQKGHEKDGMRSIRASGTRKEALKSAHFWKGTRG